jgi:hypothetical protein
MGAAAGCASAADERVQFLMRRLSLLTCFLLIGLRAAVGCSARSYQEQPVRPDFVVVVTHGNKAIPGVDVVLTPIPGASVFLSVSTDERGVAEIHDLPAGKYWLAASYRDIEAGRELIEVSPNAKKPRKQFDFRWAEYSYEMRTVSGKLTGLVKGNTGHALQDLIHPIEVSHPGIPITLRNASSDNEYQTSSDSSGTFLFDPVPQGTYILTIGGGMKSFGGYIADPTIFVIDLTSSGRRDFLSLRLQDSGCGGAEYELRDER